MGIARQHGERQTTVRGHSHHQENAHKLLSSHGFEFDRMTSGTKNVYTHEDGRRIVVSATPKNPSVDLGYIRQQMTSPRQDIPAGRNEGTMATTTAPSPTAPLTTMADPFLLKEPTTREGQRARSSALAGWVKRALERHGPLEPKILMSAGHELGFSDSQLNRARKDAGAVAYTIVGSGAGKGRGGNPTWVALEHQVPEGASVIGRGTKPSEPSGVQPEAQEPPEHPIGENNGAGPEPREEPAQAPDPIDWDGTGVPPLNQSEKTGTLLPPLTGPIALKPLPTQGQTPRGGWSITEDGDVGAAAQLLLQSLGLKVMGPEVAQAINAAAIHIRRSRDEIELAQTAIRKALIAVNA